MRPNMMTAVKTAVMIHRKGVEKVNPKRSHHRINSFFPFFSFLLPFLYHVPI